MLQLQRGVRLCRPHLAVGDEANENQMKMAQKEEDSTTRALTLQLEGKEQWERF